MAKQKKTKDEVMKAFRESGLDTSQLQVMCGPMVGECPDYYILLNSQKSEVVLANVSGGKLMDMFATIALVRDGVLPLLLGI